MSDFGMPLKLGWRSERACWTSGAVGSGINNGIICIEMQLTVINLHANIIDIYREQAPKSIPVVCL